MPRSVSSRAVAAASLALLAAYGAALCWDAFHRGVGIARFEPWPLGGSAGGAAAAVSPLLGLCLGWALPGLALTALVGVPASAAALLARAFALGVGYLVVLGLVHGVVAGHAPGRLTLVLLLAAPAALLWLRRPQDRVPTLPPLLALALMVVAAAPLWPKLAREGLNGDGTEAYELARSLDAHGLPYWDLETAEPPGRFGTPVVNPFLTHSYLTAAHMALLGRGELAARLPLLPAFVVGAIVAAGAARRVGVSGAAYVAGVTLSWLVWNAYWVGYEPSHTDLAEPAGTDMLTTALFLAGVAETARGWPALACLAYLLAGGVLYSAPVLAVLFLAALWRLAPARDGRALGLFLGAGSLALLLALAYGVSTGQIDTWIARVWTEYSLDLTDPGRRVASSEVLLPLLLATGGLPVLAAARWSRLTPVSRALLVTAGGYLALVLAHSYKNLHYLAPLPFLLVAPALDAATRSLRLAALSVVAGGLLLAWPDTREIRRDNLELGRLSCVDGLSYEEASLAGGIVYDAFSPPGPTADRYAVGKHTFVRYALDLGGGDCVFRLGHAAPEGFTRVAGDAGVGFYVRDVETWARWRLRVPAVPRSWLFPRIQPPPLPELPDAWPRRVALDETPGSALVIGGPEPHRARLLVPCSGNGPARVGLDGGPVVAILVDGRSAAFEVESGVLSAGADACRAGYQVLELEAAPGAGIAPRWLERPRTGR